MTRTLPGALCICLLAALLIVGPGCGNSPTTDDLATVTALTILLLANFIVLGAVFQLTAQASFSDGTTSNPSGVAWTSSNPNVATVSADGVLRAVGLGIVIITAVALGLTTTQRIEIGAFLGVWTGIAVIAACTSIGFFSQINFCDVFAPSSQHSVRMDLTQNGRQVRGNMWFSDNPAFGGDLVFNVDDDGKAQHESGTLWFTQSNGTFVLTPGDDFSLEHPDADTTLIPAFSLRATFDGNASDGSSDINVMGLSMRFQFSREAP